MYKSGGALGVQMLNSATTLIQRQPRRLTHADYVLHRTGCSEEKDQLLRKGWKWPHSRGRCDTRCEKRPRPLDENSAGALDSGDGSHHLHWLDLRSSEATCSCPEGGASADAACHRRGQEEKRSHRCQQDC